MLEEQKYIDFGIQLVEGCEVMQDSDIMRVLCPLTRLHQDTYKQTLTHIGPETFSWNETTVPANQTEFYERAGFYITDSGYALRPEVIESFYYAYRATGDSKYQDVRLFPIRPFPNSITDTSPVRVECFCSDQRYLPGWFRLC